VNVLCAPGPHFIAGPEGSAMSVLPPPAARESCRQVKPMQNAAPWRPQNEGLLSSRRIVENLRSDPALPYAFETKANFSGMDGTLNLFISDVFHKAWVEVNEEGTEAAAATIVAVTASAMPMNPPPPPPVFRADHPFIFCIRDTRSGSLLFLGRLADPSH